MSVRGNNLMLRDPRGASRHRLVALLLGLVAALAAVLLPATPARAIYGGSALNAGQGSWTAAIVSSGSNKPVCTGVLVTSNIVLSALDCFKGVGPEATSGEVILDNPNPMGNPEVGERIAIKAVRSQFAGKVAVVILNGHAKTTPIPIAAWLPPQDDALTVIGYGGGDRAGR